MQEEELTKADHTLVNYRLILLNQKTQLENFSRVAAHSQSPTYVFTCKERLPQPQYKGMLQ